MSANILVVDEEPDVAELFRQHFRRGARQGTYVLHFANSRDEALPLLDHEITPELLCPTSTCRDGRPATAWEDQDAVP